VFPTVVSKIVVAMDVVAFVELAMSMKCAVLGWFK
jgi:hypothetical protein